MYTFIHCVMDYYFNCDYSIKRVHICRTDFNIGWFLGSRRQVSQIWESLWLEKQISFLKKNNTYVCSDCLQATTRQGYWIPGDFSIYLFYSTIYFLVLYFLEIEILERFHSSLSLIYVSLSLTSVNFLKLNIVLVSVKKYALALSTWSTWSRLQVCYLSVRALSLRSK